MPPPRKKISLLEKKFAYLMAETGLGPAEAGRKVFKIPAEKGSKEEQRLKDLARAPRVREAYNERKKQLEREAAAETLMTAVGPDVDKLRSFAYRKLLETVRDSSSKGATRLQAVKVLEKLHAPSADINLILKWVDYVWRYGKAHCPCCHNSYSLEKIHNRALDQYREAFNKKVSDPPETDLERRLALIHLADKKKTPHKGQIPALEAPERHIIGLGAARAGKSWLLSLIGLSGLLLPGVEIWLLAQHYSSAQSEAEYIQNFLKTLFYPYENQLIKKYEDKKNGELHLETKWGSTLKIKSAKSKGSITGRELEMALIAEPGWIAEDVYEELRARMSSRLGRIFAFGTPKGSGGFIARMTRATGRDPNTGRIIRMAPSERLISNGATWGISMLIYNLKPQDNPEFVQSELASARYELTDVEYESEFEGKITNVEGAKFPTIGDHNLLEMTPNYFNNAVFVLGIDQGPKNFGACLTAYDGEIIVPCYEYFDSSEKTMKANLKNLMYHVPLWIRSLGGRMDNWKLTITDKHPQVWQIFEELRTEGRDWPTDVVERHVNNRASGDNWRRETQEWVNNRAKAMSTRGHIPCLIFHDSQLKISEDMVESPGAILLFDQVKDALEKAENIEKESGRTEQSDKGWIIKDAWRADHVVDAWFFTMWTVLSGQLFVPEGEGALVGDPWTEAKRAFEFTLARQEAHDLAGAGVPAPKDNDLFEKIFGRKREPNIILGTPGYYTNES